MADFFLKVLSRSVLCVVYKKIARLAPPQINDVHVTKGGVKIFQEDGSVAEYLTSEGVEIKYAVIDMMRQVEVNEAAEESKRIAEAEESRRKAEEDKKQAEEAAKTSVPAKTAGQIPRGQEGPAGACTPRQPDQPKSPKSPAAARPSSKPADSYVFCVLIKQLSHALFHGAVLALFLFVLLPCWLAEDPAYVSMHGIRRPSFCTTF